MTAQWHFKELRPGDKDRQPTQGEFFATDAIRSPAEALVRETIQNSLDAGLKGVGSQVRVRFHLANGVHALPPSVAQRYFKDGWAHFFAEGNGLDDVPYNTDDCPFLVSEDFGTTGLVGDVDQYRHIPGKKNPFYYFFRTEGRSGKGEEDRGRWGVGKYVFPRSSRVNAFLAMTVRHDDAQRLLMGQAVLKSHTVKGRYYTPDGDYGHVKPAGLVLPVSTPTLLDQFCLDFGLRRTTEPGLSVVVPWVDADITKDSLLKAVIEDYFYPILAGGLVVQVSNGGDEVEINKESLSTASKLLGEEFSSRMLPLLGLAAWANERKPPDFECLAPPSTPRPVWDATAVPSARLAHLRNQFRVGEKLAIRVPLTVRETKKAPRDSHFDIFLVNDAGDDGETVFIRDGIIIPDVRAPRVPGVRSLVVVDDPPLATLLGDAENPAHTQWQKDREHFRNKYTGGKSYIDFVSRSVAMFVRYLNESDQQPDRDILREIFSLPKHNEPDDKKEKSKPRKRNKGETLQPEPTAEPKRRRFVLAKVPGGFTVTRGEQEALTPAFLRIAVAYDRRRGSPLKKYASADFRTNEAPIKVETQGAKATEKQMNKILVKITDPDFRVTVSGFDENRDLFVDVEAKESIDDSQA